MFHRMPILFPHYLSDTFSVSTLCAVSLLSSSYIWIVLLHSLAPHILPELLLSFFFFSNLSSCPFIFFFLFIYCSSSTLIFLKEHSFLLQHAVPSLCHLCESPFIFHNSCHYCPYYWKTEQLHSMEMPMAARRREPGMSFPVSSKGSSWVSISGFCLHSLAQGSSA